MLERKRTVPGPAFVWWDLELWCERGPQEVNESGGGVRPAKDGRIGVKTTYRMTGGGKETGIGVISEGREGLGFGSDR